MLLSYNWLKELLPALKLSPPQVADLLTLHAYETVIKREFALPSQTKVVKITKIEPHPNADRLRLATVTDGQQTVRVVCGAPNIMEGQVVPFSPPGTNIFDQDGQLFELTVAKIRGIDSPGMLNSKRELGLGEDHDGIYILPPDTPLNSKLSDHIPNDTILEADVTPNRAHDSLCHLGVAYEIAAITGLEVKLPDMTKLPARKTGDLTIDIADAAACPRYMTIAVEGIHNGPAPLWLQTRLLMIDQNPHNALVDITNYVMFEIGNPTHAFDTHQLTSQNMGVRRAKAGEHLVLLDDSQQELTADMLVVTNDDKPVAIAGIKGGQGSGITESTASALLEIANFEPYSIQTTALALNQRTEAASRFLKGLDPNLVEVAAARLLYLVKEITGGKVAGFADRYPKPLKPWTVTFRPARASQIAGTPITADSAKKYLQSIGCTVDHSNPDTWQVTPPTTRLDITGEHDVVEEVIRLFGLTNIPTIKDENPTPKPLSHELFVREKIRDKMVELGFTETYNYSFEPKEASKFLYIAEGDHLKIKNPLAPEQSYLRVSLLPGLLAHMKKNRAQFERKNIKVERALFELGHVYAKGKEDSQAVLGVIEKQTLAFVSIVPNHTRDTVLQELTNLLNIELTDELRQKVLRQNRALMIKEKNAQKETKYRYKLHFEELDIDALIQAATQDQHANSTLAEIESHDASPVQYEELNRYPSVYRDLSILVDPDTPVEKVKEIIERAGGELLADTDLFDEYTPEDDSQAKAGTQKSLAFHLEYRAADRTLTDGEVNKLHQAIEAAVRAELQAEIR